jgi:outer membrane protein assembly factor BamB
MIKRILVAAMTMSLTACTGFFEKDNTPPPTPLSQLTPEIKPNLIWSTKTGAGSAGDYLKLSPTLYGNTIYTSSTNGTVTATNKQNGHANWSVNTHAHLTSGPGVGADIVVIGSREGEVIALQQENGHVRWKTSIAGEIIAKPAVGNQLVVIKSTDGTLRALSSQSGQERWSYQQTEPGLILRGSSTPLLQGNSLFAGFANGNLAKINLNNGQVSWMRPIATPEGGFSIQRMIDIDANPIIHGHRLYAATYQGNIASLDWNSGSTLWSHAISSYTGMAVDDQTVYISDAAGDVWAFSANNGQTRWQQTGLRARILSAPASMGNYVVVGDEEGYLHWLSKRDGHIAGREFAGDTIFAGPIVENNVLYAQTSNGSLVAYTLSS